ncbi:hypothetical protein PSN13_01366 [Micromonospora saelicesensis]|uniref:Mutator family transposase n=1 Tax=Micromonospora saelicesensis TaxID=285676 RepID=A0A328NQN9_9ACTN|nr:hypothetical protein PSN13_01366 [Micromonospora saelicesensis]
MTATQNDQSGRKKRAEPSAETKAAVELVRAAKEQGLSLTGPDGLLRQLTKTVLKTALNEEMTEHLGYEKHDVSDAGAGNIRNGSRSKTVLTAALARRRSAFHATGPAPSSPKSSRSGSGACPALTKGRR